MNKINELFAKIPAPVLVYLIADYLALVPDNLSLSEKIEKALYK